MHVSIYWSVVKHSFIHSFVSIYIYLSKKLSVLFVFVCSLFVLLLLCLFGVFFTHPTPKKPTKANNKNQTKTTTTKPPHTHKRTEQTKTNKQNKQKERKQQLGNNGVRGRGKEFLKHESFAKQKRLEIGE